MNTNSVTHTLTYYDIVHQSQWSIQEEILIGRTGAPYNMLHYKSKIGKYSIYIINIKNGMYK